MNLQVSKRKGKMVKFDHEKIINALSSAVQDAGQDGFNTRNFYFSYILPKIAVIEESSNSVSVEQLNDLIEDTLYEKKEQVILDQFHQYRTDRAQARFLRTELSKTVDSLGNCTDRDNANVGNNFAAKTLRIASETNKYHNLAKMPKHLSKLHENGDLYYHDLDSYNLTINCLHIDTRFHFNRGFNTGYGMLTEPHRIESAAELSCVMLQSTQNDCFGGQSHVDFDNALGDYIEPTRLEIINDFYDVWMAANSDSVWDSNLTPRGLYNVNDEFRKLVDDKLLSRVHSAMQSVVCKYNTMHSRAGSQVPFSSLNIGLPDNEDAALICKVFLEEFNKGINGAPPIFPNVIFRVKEGFNRSQGDRYYYLYQLACKVAANRMNPTFMSMDSPINLPYYQRGIKPATMGCRTYICSDVNGDDGPARRGNNAPVTINLPRLGILSKKNIKRFYELLDERLGQARDSLLRRMKVLSRLKGRDLPFVVGQHFFVGSEEVGPDDSIEPILRHGSWAIGFIGLAETLVALTGHHHGETDEARKLGEEIVQHIRDFCDKTTKETHLNWGCYATPAEGLSGKFILQDRKRFGVIPGVTDKDYYTNSYHIPVGFNISIIDKLIIEGVYHPMCNSGHISYIEFDGAPDAHTVEKIVTYAFSSTSASYIGINFHLRYCKNCGTTVTESSNECPICHSRAIQGISRVTGYLSLDERFGVGKTAERKDRIAHGGERVGVKYYNV